jgi:hypothetical protein
VKVHPPFLIHFTLSHIVQAGCPTIADGLTWIRLSLVLLTGCRMAPQSTKRRSVPTLIKSVRLML